MDRYVLACGRAHRRPTGLQKARTMTSRARRATKRAVKSALTELPKFPWRVEVLGNTRRIVDVDGNDIARLGDAHNAADRATAEFIVAAANAVGVEPKS